MGGKPTLHKHQLLTRKAKSFGSEKLKTKSEKCWYALLRNAFFS